MTDQALDGLARRVMLDAARQEYGGLMAERPEHEFSPEFERKMRRLLRRASHPMRRRAVQAAACLALAVLLSGCAVLAVSQEARAAFAGWMRELGREWFSYHYAGKIEDTPKNTVYYPARLPEGYREIQAPEPGTFVRALYGDQNGEILSFAYQTGLEDMTFHVEWEGAETRRVPVSGIQADFCQNAADGANVLVWTDKGCVFWLAGKLTEEELVRSAESLRESEPLDWVYRPTWLPGPVALVSSVEADGEGSTVYETGDEERITFCYSKSGTTPYAGRTDGQTAGMENGTAMLYPLDESGEQALTWADRETGYAFWLVSSIPPEDMVTFAEGVKIYSNTINSAFESEPFSDELIMGPPCEQVRQALTDEFAASVKAYAERDASAGVYMQSDYSEMVMNYMRAHISPQRETAAERVSDLMDAYAGSPPGAHVLCLVEPFCFAGIRVDGGLASAHIYDLYGYMIAAYHQEDGSWSSIWTLGELQFHHAANQIYLTAFRGDCS